MIRFVEYRGWEAQTWRFVFEIDQAHSRILRKLKDKLDTGCSLHVDVFMSQLYAWLCCCLDVL